MPFDKEPFQLDETYAHLGRDGTGALHDVKDDFWPRLMSGELVLNGWLATSYVMTGDTPHWEMHPSGEELICCLSGAAQLVIEEDAVERTVAVGPGDTILMPRGAWHRFVVPREAKFLVVTFGEGTEHREIVPA